MSSSPFCTCTNLDCPLHPTKHDKGCSPCISKNLKMGEMPGCFFHKIGAPADREGDTFRDFARYVMETEEPAQ